MFCPNCGTQNLDDAVFCQKCGKRFNTINYSEPNGFAVKNKNQIRGSWFWFFMIMFIFDILIIILAGINEASLLIEYIQPIEPTYGRNGEVHEYEYDTKYIVVKSLMIFVSCFVIFEIISIFQFFNRKPKFLLNYQICKLALIILPIICYFVFDNYFELFDLFQNSWRFDYLNLFDLFKYFLFPAVWLFSFIGFFVMTFLLL
ncbi:MAG: zinc ribbon domain-containing protein [Ruminococcus sp.]|jgi:hypothetical protein|nr:zinc ribbon domain-containing protein [Ruminococcus sp.]